MLPEGGGGVHYLLWRGSVAAGSLSELRLTAHDAADSQSAHLRLPPSLSKQPPAPSSALLGLERRGA